MKKKNYFDEDKFTELDRTMHRLLNAAANCASILMEHGYTVSVKTVSDCLFAKMHTVQGEEATDQTLFAGEQVQMEKRYRIRTIYKNVESLKAELNAKVDAAEKSGVTEADKVERVEAVVADFETMMTRIVEMAHPKFDPSEDERRMFVQFLTFDDKGRAGLSRDYKDFIENKSVVYCESENALKAMEAHQRAVDALNDLAAVIREGMMCDDFNELFYLENGKVERVFIDYERFVK